MINQRFDIKNAIFMVVICVIVVVLMLLEFIAEGIITNDNWLAVVCFYSCFILLIFAMTEIEYCAIENHISVARWKYKTFMLFEENKDMLCAFQDYCVKEREKAIIKELALIRMYCGEKYNEEFCLKKYKEGDRVYFDNLLKKKKIEDKSYYKASVREFFQTKDLPMHFYQFQSYYKGEMLKQRNSISGIIMTTFSIILGIISLVSLNAFTLLSYRFWVILLSGFVVEIFSTLLFWKSRLKNYIELQANEYEKLKKDIAEFLAS